MKTCQICGKELDGAKTRYCSKECQKQAANEAAKIRRLEAKKKKKRQSLNDYGVWDKARTKLGLPHISYGQLQGRKYLDEKKGEKDG